ncbi:hypothetical protein [Micromonospora endophytica]|uniref:Uncharacterized protein n=1 Tax=Micromonospora endophytica TaxID=515350 RepID=A0A2W2BSP5_9ACTN|nr:hypothetical protein [Micromonospora endophytica]PZF90261.1 hypothetical protein C1I93_22975 [Micromonospora endophytica]RIW51347.1 hypothetical protein D3H59_00245 [Micromonospora endophytica]BCJ62026.1 hypothetical protein Jiend_54480 [Micromonospora endophytica]
MTPTSGAGESVPPSAVALAAALASVRRAPVGRRWAEQPWAWAADSRSADRDRALSRANQAGALAAKEYLDHRATPAGHPAYEKERQERNWTSAEYSRLRRAALAGPRVTFAAQLTSVRGAGRVGRPAVPPRLGTPRRRRARTR